VTQVSNAQRIVADRGRSREPFFGAREVARLAGNDGARRGKSR
jgi:hypothetical protein